MGDFWIRLTTGRDIRLRELHQSETYEGVMLGHPDREEHEGIVRAALRRASERVDGVRSTPHLIPLAERLTPIPPEKRGEATESERIDYPAIICTARFDSLAPARDPSEHGSSLVIVWFQDNLAMPIDKAVLDAITAVNWNELAYDWSW